MALISPTINERRVLDLPVNLDVRDFVSFRWLWWRCRIAWIAI